MRVLTAPNHFSDEMLRVGSQTVFLAGGISNCPNWQQEFLDLMSKRMKNEDDFLFINPRRDDFDVSKREMSEEQITWEFGKLNTSDVIIFWFPKETLCPITLYELGRMVGEGAEILVGCHPEYQRKFDVEYQLRLADPKLKVVFSLEELADQTAALII